jgi:MFS family permease
MFSALRSRNYALFWVGSFVSNVGTWMQTVALGWLIYEMTGSASWLGTVSFAANAPALFAGLVGGAVADRADRKLLLVGTQAVAAAAAFLLALLTLRGSLEIWRVIAIALGSGLALSFYTPVVHATIPSLVPAEDLLNAVSLNSVQFNLARIVGPVAAGFAYSRIGAAGCFWLNGLSFLVLAISLAINTTLQVKVAENMRGRVMGMLSFALFGLSTLGSVLLGMVGDRIGITSALRLGGLVILAVVAFVTVRAPSIFQPVDAPPRS